VVLRFVLLGIFSWNLSGGAVFGAGAASLSSSSYTGGPWNASTFPNKATGFSVFNGVGSTVSLGQNLYGNSVFDLSAGGFFPNFSAGPDGSTYLVNQTFSMDLYATDPASSISVDNNGCQLSYDGAGDNLSLKIFGPDMTSTVSTSVTAGDLTDGIHISLTMGQEGQFTYQVSSVTQEADLIYSDSGVISLSEEEGGGSLLIQTSSSAQFDNLNISTGPDSSGVAPVPEPSSMAMMAVSFGLLALIPLRKRLHRA
jgi:hypothetical protein